LRISQPRPVSLLAFLHLIHLCIGLFYKKTQTHSFRPRAYPPRKIRKQVVYPSDAFFSASCGTGQKQDEFIAAPSCQKIVGADVHQYYTSEFLQMKITGFMTFSVIDFFQAVQVKKDKRQGRRLASFNAGQFSLGRMSKGISAQCPCQRILNLD